LIITKSFINFIKGDTSGFANWEYKKSPLLIILMISFTSLTTIFILNVFIGLFSEAMKFDIKTSILMMKAEVQYNIIII